MAATVNLVPNGDFAAGNSSFASDYVFAPLSNTTEAQYTVRANPSPWNQFFISAADHTPDANGLMFVGNGSPIPGQQVWVASGIPVVQNQAYFFEAFVMNVCCIPSFGGGPSAVNPAILSFYANDVLLGTRSTGLLGVWEGLSTQWNSGASTTVTLKLLNSNTVARGNDFAVDDVFLGTETTVLPIPIPGALWLLALGLVALGASAGRPVRRPLRTDLQAASRRAGLVGALRS
jgi:hypothetical protein